MRLPIPPAFSLPLLFTAILLPALPLLGSDSTDEPSTSSPAPTRLHMAPGTLEQTDPRNCVSQAAEMANAENQPRKSGPLPHRGQRSRAAREKTRKRDGSSEGITAT